MLPSFIKVPNTPLKLARRLGLGDLRRHKKDGHLSGLAHMIACMLYDNPIDSKITKIRFLTLAVILLAPEGSGLFMYIFLWLIIPPENDEQYKTRTTRSKNTWSWKSPPIRALNTAKYKKAREQGQKHYQKTPWFGGLKKEKITR